jgi:hypothetical protein
MHTDPAAVGGLPAGAQHLPTSRAGDLPPGPGFHRGTGPACLPTRLPACTHLHTCASVPLPAVSGLCATAALQVGFEFLSRFYPASKLVLVPNPSWANHHAICERSGLQVQLYRYYKPETRGLDYEVGKVAGCRW